MRTVDVQSFLSNFNPLLFSASTFFGPRGLSLPSEPISRPSSTLENCRDIFHSLCLKALQPLAAWQRLSGARLKDDDICANNLGSPWAQCIDRADKQLPASCILERAHVSGEGLQGSLPSLLFVLTVRKNLKMWSCPGALCLVEGMKLELHCI